MLEFWNFSEPQNLWVFLGAVFLGATAGAVGAFNFLKKRSLVGDALAHAALPGITTAFLLFNSRNPAVIVLGASISCALGYWAIEFLTSRTKIKEDSALAIVLSVFFALGVFQLSLIQKIPGASQAGLENMLFGRASSLVPGDLKVLFLLSVSVLLALGLLFNQLKVVTFDSIYARSVGINASLMNGVLGVLVVLVIVVGVQMVGVVLMAALVLTPAASARYFTDSLSRLIILSGVFGGVSGAIGANISYALPKMPTGPWIVVAISTIFLFSLVFAPRKGLLARHLRRKANRRRIRRENIVRSIFKIGDEAVSEIPWVKPVEILAFRKMTPRELESSLEELSELEQIERGSLGVRLTGTGVKLALLITRYHRLWESYLSENLELPSDHLHEDAEEIEHVLTEEVEQFILEELGSKATDPHGASIPPSQPDVLEGDS